MEDWEGKSLFLSRTSSSSAAAGVGHGSGGRESRVCPLFWFAVMSTGAFGMTCLFSHTVLGSAFEGGLGNNECRSTTDKRLGILLAEVWEQREE